ncbi:hypothetical protein CDAR_296001 [Caerostris darwini]|uniref:Uncharacterized protein n=1 Tax=Caerostris darwini TaxID=1538125 RepID=A0AAV4SYU6_9ARAC|nr:hypothetical protein CDAR_296001 [Caerostris darwini]
MADKIFDKHSQRELYEAHSTKSKKSSISSNTISQLLEKISSLEQRIEELLISTTSQMKEEITNHCIEAEFGGFTIRMVNLVITTLLSDQDASQKCVTHLATRKPRKTCLNSRFPKYIYSRNALWRHLWADLVAQAR